MQLDFSKPKQCSRVLVQEFSALVACDLHKKYVEARNIRHNIPLNDTKKPIPKLFKMDNNQIVGLSGTRIRALWNAKTVCF